MTVRIVTAPAPATQPAEHDDGPFGPKPEAVNGAFWADPVFWVTTLAEKVIRGDLYDYDFAGWWDDDDHDGYVRPGLNATLENERLARAVVSEVAHTMFVGDPFHWPDGRLRDPLDIWTAHVFREARRMVARVLADPGSRLVGDVEDGPILLAEEPSDPDEWWDVPEQIGWIRSSAYRTEYERSVHLVRPEAA